MRPLRRPLHLLFLDKPFAHDVVDYRFHENRADGVALPVSFAEVRDAPTVVTNVGVEIGDATKQPGDCLSF